MKQQTKTKFKQTEIGMIPEEWEVKAISEVAQVVGGGTPSTKNSEYWDGDIAWVTPKDLSTFNFRYIKRGERNITKKGLENSSVKLLPRRTVLLTTRAPVGYLAIADNLITTNQGFRNLIPNEKTNSEFLFYLLKRNVEILKSNASGTTFGELSGSRLKALRFPFPPLPEQRAIAKVLSDLDAKIELNQQMNKTLEAIGQAIFKHWFIDFEFPNEEGKPYKSSGGEMVYNEELGKEIPKGWGVKELKEIVSRLGPGTNFQPKRTDVGIPFLNVKNISNGFLDLSDVKYISNEDYAWVHKSWKPEEHDILISRIGTLGNVAIIRKEDLPLSVHYNIIDIKPGDVDYAFLYFLLTSKFFQKEYHLRKVQTVQEYITIENVETIKIALPDNKFLKKMSLIFFNLINKIEINYTSAKTLSVIRDSLLPKLMSGKIRVPLEVINN